MRLALRRLGFGLAVLGVLGVLGALLSPDAGEAIALASNDSTEKPQEPAPMPAWRDVLLVAGGVCLAAGLGLVALAMLPGRPKGG